MSPPAQLTRMSTAPELGVDLLLHRRDRGLVADVAADRGDASAMPRDLVRDRVEIGRLAILGRRGPGQVVDRDIGAELGQPLGHHAPEPAARAGDERDLAASSLVIPQSPLSAPRPIARMLVALRRIMVEFVIRDRAIVAALPGRAKIGVVGEAVDPRCREAGGERRRGLAAHRCATIPAARSRTWRASSAPGSSTAVSFRPCAASDVRALRPRERRRRRSRSARGDSPRR